MPTTKMYFHLSYDVTSKKYDSSKVKEWIACRMLTNPVFTSVKMVSPVASTLIISIENLEEEKPVFDFFNSISDVIFYAISKIECDEEGVRHLKVKLEKDSIYDNFLAIFPMDILNRKEQILNPEYILANPIN